MRGTVLYRDEAGMPGCRSQRGLRFGGRMDTIVFVILFFAAGFSFLAPDEPAQSESDEIYSSTQRAERRQSENDSDTSKTVQEQWEEMRLHPEISNSSGMEQAPSIWSKLGGKKSSAAKTLQKTKKKAGAESDAMIEGAKKARNLDESGRARNMDDANNAPIVDETPANDSGPEKSTGGGSGAGKESKAGKNKSKGKGQPK